MSRAIEDILLLEINRLMVGMEPRQTTPLPLLHGGALQIIEIRTTVPATIFRVHDQDPAIIEVICRCQVVVMTGAGTRIKVTVMAPRHPLPPLRRVHRMAGKGMEVFTDLHPPTRETRKEKTVTEVMYHQTRHKLARVILEAGQTMKVAVQ
jgi:hypothetical protein